jgi:cell wall assembly regulator SMI1
MTAADDAVLVWQQIEAEVRSRAPALTSRLLPPASPQALSRAEAALGVELPDSVVAVYLVHDGLGVPAVLESRTRASALLPLAEMLEHWRSLTGLLDEGRFDDCAVEQVRGPVKADWYNRGWLPVASDGAGNYFCIDLDPAEGGTPGQVIAFRHDSPERWVEAPDLATFVATHLDVEEWAEREGAARKR